jgi:hypothetical protein
MNRKLIFISIVAGFFLFRNPSVDAQLKNSVYSMAGVGRIYDDGCGINRAMGGTGIAFQSGNSLNTLNPASALGIPCNAFHIELGACGINERSTKGTTTQTASDFNFSYFSAGLYLKKWWTLTFGIRPFSSMDYEVHTRAGIGGDQTQVEKKIRGTGGLNRVVLGQSFGRTPGIAVGFNASYVFGPMTETETVDSSGAFSGYQIKNERTARTFYADYGVQLSARTGGWIHTIGVTAGAHRRIRTNDVRTLSYGGESAALEPDEDSILGVPAKLGFGVSTRKGDRFRAGFDYERQNWSEFDWNNQNLKTRDSRRYSFGAEASSVLKGRWLNALIFRTGAFFKQTALEVRNTPIDSKGIDFGIGIPYNAVDVLNVSVEYGEEGTLENGLIRSSYWMVDLSLSMHQFLVPRPTIR